ncbi:MAG: desulfoferrodoxin, partial [Acidobacteria bacterium]
MTKRTEIYKCNVCGNIVEIIGEGVGTLVCCGEDMELSTEKTADSSTEKHVPVIEKIDGGYRVYVGSTLHPMEEKHWIQWIELTADGISHKKYLNPGDKPEAVFAIKNASTVSAREFCNL